MTLMTAFMAAVLLALLWCETASAQTVTVQTKDGALALSVAKTARGLFSEEFAVSANGETVSVRGFSVKLREGVGDFAKTDWSADGSKMTVVHHLTDGKTIKAVVALDDRARLVKCYFTGLENAWSMESPCLSSKVARLYSDVGWVITNPSKAHRRSRLTTNFIVNERANEWTELLACDFAEGYVFDPETDRCVVESIPTCNKLAFTLGFAKPGNVVDLVRRYRTTLDIEPPATIEKLAGRFLFDEWTGTPVQRVIDQLEKIRYAGCTDLVVLDHVWQQYGYDNKFPDVYPPNDRVGGTEGIRKLAEYCNSHGIPFGLHDNFSDLYPDAPSFKQEQASSHFRNREVV